MGLRFRKSINLGGFRINLSKSGIGYSYGIKGLRCTKKANGGTRTTASLPGTGLSYVHDSSNKKAKTNQKHPETLYADDNEISFNSEVIESTSNEFISTMNEATTKNKRHKIFRIIAIIGIAVGVLYTFYFIQNQLPLYSISFAILAAICLIIYFIIPKVTVKLEINFNDAQLESAYKDVENGINTLKSSTGFWEICSQQSVSDWKNNAGAQSVIKRKKAKITPNTVKFIETDLELQSIDAQEINVVFLPNFLAVYQNNSWKAIEYSQVKTRYFENIFIESESVPDDTEILNYTYLHPNKSGGPDSRYSNNP